MAGRAAGRRYFLQEALYGSVKGLECLSERLKSNTFCIQSRLDEAGEGESRTGTVSAVHSRCRVGKMGCREQWMGGIKTGDELCAGALIAIVRLMQPPCPSFFLQYPLTFQFQVAEITRFISSNETHTWYCGRWSLSLCRSRLRSRPQTSTLTAKKCHGLNNTTQSDGKDTEKRRPLFHCRVAMIPDILHKDSGLINKQGARLNPRHLKASSFGCMTL